MADYKVVSLFSGCGELDLGIEGGFSYLGKYYDKNPFKIIWANNINEKATKTQKLNFKDLDVVCGDITKILNGTQNNQLNFLEDVNTLPQHADVVIGGFEIKNKKIGEKMESIIEIANLDKSFGEF